MRKPLKSFPIWTFNLSYTEEQRNRMIAWVMKFTSLKQYYDSENFAVPDNEDFKALYKAFYKTASSFLNFSPSERNSEKCWAFVSSRDFAPAFWHNHIESASISSVYYLKVNEDEQGIRFAMNGKEVLHKPKNNELIIFPNWLLHYPIPSKTEPRISINMEILAKETVNNIFIDY